MNDECIDIQDWYRLKEATKGSREKQWVVKPLTQQSSNEVEIFLFKESNKRYPAEFWAEIIAAEVGKIVGIQTPETYCAKSGDKYAALIKFFLKVEDLLDGIAKIQIENPKYRLSETRRNLIKRIICLRRDLLKEEFQLR